MRSRMFLGAAAVAAVAMVFAGCGGAPPELEPTPTRTAQQPVFGSLDDAFEAAVAAFTRYIELSNVIGAEGGVAPERLLEVVDDNDWAAEEIQGFRDFETNHVRVVGGITFSKSRLAQYQDASSFIEMYTCADVSAARVVDQNDVDITPERQEHVPYKVTLSVTRPETVRISRIEAWDGLGIC